MSIKTGNDAEAGAAQHEDDELGRSKAEPIGGDGAPAYLLTALRATPSMSLKELLYGQRMGQGRGVDFIGFFVG